MTEMNIPLKTIQNIYRMLVDEESRRIYLDRLSYLISGEFRYMRGCIASFAEEYRTLDTMPDKAGLRRLFRQLPKDRNVILYGAGKDARLLLPFFINDKRFIGFCSRSEAEQKAGLHGYPVLPPEEVVSQKNLSVVIASLRYRDEILQGLTDGGYPPELIFDGPRYYRHNSAAAEQYFGPDFMKFDEKEVFVDAGCCDFGSTLALARRCGCVKKVYAFEPDPGNYQKCRRAIEERDRSRIIDVEIFQSGVWSERTALCFDARGDGGSCVCENHYLRGGITVPVMTIDEVVDPKNRVTMLKMDIEGSELEALKGARETILRDRPKLAICIYHKPEDLWEIPLYIKGLVPEYRLYIRHHSYDVVDTVLYAIPPKR